MRAWGSQAGEGFQSDLEEGGYHYDGEDEDAEGFEAAATHGVIFVIARSSGDEQRCRPHDKRR